MVGSTLYRENTVALRYLEEGTVIPWEDYDLQEELKTPLKIDKVGDVSGFVSGERSAIVKFNDKWFKLKGCNHQPDHGPYSDFIDQTVIHGENNGVYVASGAPWGAMTEQSARNELKITGVIGKKYKEFGLEHPMKPAGLTKYESRFNDKNVFSAMLEIKTDTRLRVALEYVVRHAPNVEEDHLETLISGVSQWLGFDQFLLNKAGVSIDPGTLGIGNYLLWNNGEGYCVSRVDLSSASDKINPKHDRKKIKDEIEAVRGYGFTYATYPVAKKLGMNPKWFMLGCTDDGEYAVEFIEVPSEDMEESKTIGDMITVSICKDRFKWVYPLDKEYQKGLEGNMPEPIDRNIIETIFQN